jgi:hypothetical protein
MLCIGTVLLVAAHTPVQALKGVYDTVSIIKIYLEVHLQ